MIQTLFKRSTGTRFEVGIAPMFVVCLTCALTGLLVGACARTGVHESTARAQPEEGPNGAATGTEPEHAALVARVPRDTRVRLFVPEMFRSLLERLEPMYEERTPGVNLVVYYGEDQPPLSAEQALVVDIDAGATVDAFISADDKYVTELLTRPERIEKWLTNEIVLIRPRTAPLRLIDLSKGSCQVAVALDRTALGRATRSALERRGIWESVTGRVGLFEDGQAIQTRVASRDLDACLGVVYRSDLWNTPERVRVIGPLEPGDETPLVHYVASWTGEGSRLIDWLGSDEAVEVAVEVGFLRLD
jgi:ABC-type molybdate transport system substrate-binding protein